MYYSGESEYNVNKITQGHSESPLTDQGIAQAKRVANRLKDIEFDKIYCSDLYRAKQTADEIIEYHSLTPIEYTKEIREMYFGKFEGKPISFLVENFKV